MKTLLYIYCIAAFIAVCFSAIDNCNSDLKKSDKTRCKARGKKDCIRKGCYFCGGQKPVCVEGQACRRTNLQPEDNCWNDEEGPVNPKKCRKKEGCSYCKHHIQYQCVRDGPIVPTAVDNCAIATEDRKEWKCKARNRKHCAKKGCHYCTNGKPKCIRGAACRRDDITDADNCWPTENLNPPNGKDCLNIYRCSWCPKSTPKCVKDDVWECPTGYKLRYGQDSCCYDQPGTTKIVGGDEADDGKWPWQALLFASGKWFCGGVLVSNRHVITAAHCDLSETVKVLLGTNSAYDGDVVMWEVDSNVGHENYDSSATGHDHDIRLITLRDTVKYTDTIQAISMPLGEKPLVGQKCIVTGWGDEYEGAPKEPVRLREGAVFIQSTEECRKQYKEYKRNEHGTFNDDIMLCAGILGGGVDACHGDSGGPLVCQRCNNCDWYLAGITSGGYGCNRANYWGIYTRVQGYYKWLTEHGLPEDSKTYSCDLSE
uniref:transmembrane protease serine 3-like isoform X2 n=1 Tax=Styela clava TaxID=7725 RepID=UPI001939DC8B|nr:transmembrane protease serine 3-like isoform X2 [Styela clava]